MTVFFTTKHLQQPIGVEISRQTTPGAMGWTHAETDINASRMLSAASTRHYESLVNSSNYAEILNKESPTIAGLKCRK
jgi:hypothetical protein